MHFLCRTYTFQRSLFKTMHIIRYFLGKFPTSIFLVPEGPQPGRVLLALNARHFLINPIVRLIWRGNFAFKAECNSTSGSEASQIYVGFHNSFNNVAVLPTIVYIAPLQANFAPGECEDGKPSAIMDFTQNLRTICPDYAEFVRRNKDKLPTSVTSLANFYPNTQILDVFRLVGRQSDGGRIFLGKTYFRDAFRSDKQIATIAFWYTLSYDDQVNPDFGVGENLPPLVIPVLTGVKLNNTVFVTFFSTGVQLRLHVPRCGGHCV